MTDSDNPRRVLLKLSGEAFGGGKVGIDTQVIRRIAEEIVPAVQQVCRWPSWSAAATSSAVPNCSRPVSIVPVATTWVCSAR